MIINYDKFLRWVERKFPDDFVQSGSEIKINSIFCEDQKKKLWCNPYGGKLGREHGVYHCWKTNRKGSLVGLVMLVEHCDYGEALDILGSSYLNEDQINEKLNSIFQSSAKEDPPSGLQLPPFTYLIDRLEENNLYKINSQLYLEERKIPWNKFYVCIDGHYRNRIIIPYYNRDNRLIYFNARWIMGKNKLKYLGPPKECGVGKGDVIYFPKWPPLGSKVYLTEGEFDAESLSIAGLYSAALGGKEISEIQADILKDYYPVLSVDNDNAGKGALRRLGNFLKFKGAKQVGHVRPPTSFKDWNEMLVKTNEKIIIKYIETFEKLLDDSEDLRLGFL